MAKLTYFPLLIDRWVAGVQELTFEERGFYISLLVWLYDSGKPIKDADHAARILRCDKRTSRRLLGKLRPKFRLTSAGLRHQLCDELLRNGGKIKNLEGNSFPLKPDPEPEEDPPPIVPPPPNRPQPGSTPKRAAFRQPDVSEVRAYCRERRNSVDPEAWMDHYTSNGWKVGKNPMRDWKAAVRTWERNQGKSKSNGGRKTYDDYMREQQAGQSDERRDEKVITGAFRVVD